MSPTIKLATTSTVKEKKLKSLDWLLAANARLSSRSAVNRLVSEVKCKQVYSGNRDGRSSTNLPKMEAALKPTVRSSKASGRGLVPLTSKSHPHRAFTTFLNNQPLPAAGFWLTGCHSDTTLTLGSVISSGVKVGPR